MNIISKLNQRLQNRRLSTLEAYWSTLGKIARAGRDRAPNALVAEIETAATALGKSPEVIEADLELLERSIELDGAPKELERAEQGLAAAQKQNAASIERAADLEKQAQAARATGETAFNQAVAAKQIATQRVRELTETQHRLADAGHPDHRHSNRQARDLRVSVESLQTELRVVDADLAAFTAHALDTDRRANMAYNTLQLRRAQLVESLHRLGMKTTAEPVPAAGDQRDEDDVVVEHVAEQVEKPLDGLSLLGHEGKGIRTTIIEED